MLQVNQIEAFYGLSQALYQVSLEVVEGAVVTLLGRNGMGKSSTIKAIMGLLPVTAGSIMFDREKIHTEPSYAIARRGLGLVPEGRQVFPNLTVQENLIATAANHRRIPTPYCLEDIFTIFPRLEERLKHYGNQLSGGEQQMLAIGRALMINPRLLILDEATEGLAPLIRQEIWRGLGILKSKGLAILIVDKNIQALLEIAEHHYIMEKGRIVWSGTSAQLDGEQQIQTQYLGV